MAEVKWVDNREKLSFSHNNSIGMSLSEGQQNGTKI